MASPEENTPQGFIDTLVDILGGGAGNPGIANYYLDALYGNWVTGSGEVYTIITSIFSIVNFLAFALGVLIFFAAFIGGVLKTALQGEILGREWGTELLPVKMFIGIAMMMPILVDNNVSLSQRWGMSLLLIGSASADYTWREAVKVTLANEGNPVSYDRLEQGIDNLYSGLVCASAMVKGRTSEAPLIEAKFADGESPGRRVDVPRQIGDGAGWKQTGSDTLGLFASERGTRFDIDGTVSAFASLADKLKPDSQIRALNFYTDGACGTYRLDHFREVGELMAGEETRGQRGNRQVTPASGSADFDEYLNAAKQAAIFAAWPATVDLIEEELRLALLSADQGNQVFSRGVSAKAKGDLASRDYFVLNNVALAHEQNIRVYHGRLSQTMEAALAGDNKTEYSEKIIELAGERGWLYAGAWVMQLNKIANLVPEASNALLDIEYTEPSNACVGFFERASKTISSMFGSDDAECPRETDIRVIPTEVLAQSDNDGSLLRTLKTCDAGSCAGNKIDQSLSVTAAQSILNFTANTAGAISASPLRDGRDGKAIMGVTNEDVERHGLTSTQKSNITDATGFSNPFSTLNGLGHGLLNYAHTLEIGAILARGFTLAQGKEAQEASTKVGRWGWSMGQAMVEWGWLKMMALMVPFTMLGALLAYVLPIAMLIRWLGPALGFIVVSLEFNLLAPLAMMMLLIPEGSGILGTNLLNVVRYIAAALLRPTLAIFGLIGGFVASFVVFGLFNGLFWEGINLSTNASLFEIIIIVYLYGYLAFQIIDKLFQLPINLTRDVLRWISPGNEPFGDAAFGELQVPFDQLSKIPEATMVGAGSR